MSIALDAPASMERVPEGYIDLENEFIVSPRRFKKKDMMNPMNETSMNLNFKEKSWVGLTHRKSVVSMDPFSEMDSGVVLPISSFGSKTARSVGSKTARSMRSPTKQKSFLLNSARTPHPYMNGDVKQPLAITDGRSPYPIVKDDDDLFDAKSFRKESMTRSKSIYASSVRAPSVHAPSVRAQSVKASSVRSKSVIAPSIRAPSAGAPSVAAKSTKSIRSYKALSVHSNKNGSKSVPRLVRSTSNTRLGSVTRRAQLSPRKGMSRSKTTVLPLETQADANEGGMAEFMNAEMSNWGDASQSARSKRSTRTSRSVAKSKISSKASPRKSIQPKMTGIPNYFKAISVS
ncbi:uncharacterized protein LOC132755186 isoform X2 [Ruditapes philippinarum]|uniref:uncharacterized protein LOC132755186 isoform X2 n=1 Tax=Ruditapes philippinarum TaxID=129788 RepID=UPI00295AB453|nr:uncharacterized protein LOC132755186 isoform X2 [Ruditapes philippinarum]